MRLFGDRVIDWTKETHMAWQRHGCIGKYNARGFGAIYYSWFLEREGAFRKSPVETAGLMEGG